MIRESMPQLIESSSGWPTLVTEWSKGKLEIEVCEDEEWGDRPVIIIRRPLDGSPEPIVMWQ